MGLDTDVEQARNQIQGQLLPDVSGRETQVEKDVLLAVVLNNMAILASSTADRDAEATEWRRLWPGFQGSSARSGLASCRVS